MTAKTVMIVEDDEGLQYYMKILIARLYKEVEVIQAYDGREALDYIQDNREKIPEVILLDLNMPGMNGFEFLENWQQSYADSETNIVILTSSQKEEDKDRARTYSAVKDYLIKPVEQSDLEKVIGGAA